MHDKVSAALNEYFQGWQALQDETKLPIGKPTAVGWKVADEAEYLDQYQKLRSHCDRIIETWMNGRWIAKMHLKNEKLPGEISLIKLMQRRPDSSDALGLDHVDFTCENIQQVEKALQASSLKWSWETNDVISEYNWISIWFNNTEAKVKQGTVIDTVIRELQELKI